VTETHDGVRFDFRSGRERTILGVSVKEAGRDFGKVGDKVPRRVFKQLAGSTEKPPRAVADLKKPPE
jgi:hypothetical protein